MEKRLLSGIFKGCMFHKGIDWDFVNTIPEMARLHNCEQNPVWHSEGNAFKHTQLACEKLEKEVFGDLKLYLSCNEYELIIIRVATLLHDIGKGVTTTQGKDGKWHAYGHEIEGEKIARVLLWNEYLPFRETICALIRYHMEPLRIFDSKHWMYRMYEIGCRVPWKLLYAVKMADLLGSVQLNGGTMTDDLQKMQLIKDTAQALNIWDFVDTDKIKPIIKYGNNRNILPWKVKYDENKVAYIMIGLPGAGKNTVITDGKIIPMTHTEISRDDIRVKLGYCKEDEKYLGTPEEEAEVTRVYNSDFTNAINHGDVIVLNNVHLKKKYREDSVNVLRANGYKIVYVYVEAPTLEFNYQRRDGQISKDIIDRMALSFEWPEASEYDELIISKQTY